MRRYSDPYVAGVGLGLVLLAAYVVVGHGLGASGGFASVAAAGTALVQGADTVARAPATAPYLTQGLLSPLSDWFVLELVGVVVGGFASAWFAGRLSLRIDRGPRIGDRDRLLFALAGGALMGVAAKLARGCTSGQALTGGALLSLGSWIFIATCFTAGYGVAPLARRLWR